MDTITGKATAHRVIAGKHVVAIEHSNGYTELYTIAGGSSLIYTITNSDMRDNNHVYERNARGALTTARPLTIGDVWPVTLNA